MKKITVLGGVSYDTIVYLHQFPEPKAQTIFAIDSQETVGSTGAGKALNLVKLGFDATLHAFIGSDEYGSNIRKILEQGGVSFIYDLDPKGTERHVNLMDQNGARISIYASTATFDPEVNVPRVEAAIKESDMVVLNINNYCRHLIPMIRKYNKEIWCDIHDYDGKNPYHNDFIQAADRIFMSSDAMSEYRQFMESLIRSGKKLVVCTHGSKGSTAMTDDGQWIETPIIEKYKRVDTNGAGDAFFAGYIYGYSHGYSPGQNLKYASIVSGLCITSRDLVYSDLTPGLVESEFQSVH
ncbi:MAG TPA: carbohydrate kinase family protein [Acidobacteriota bacterium]|nr:carbohydrate kinase family protein [Acidobacteriota bacterium]